MAVAEKTPDVAAAPAATRRRRSFKPHYPAWLVAPSAPPKASAHKAEPFVSGVPEMIEGLEAFG